MLPLALKYYREIIIAVMALIIVFMFAWVKSLKSDLKGVESALSFQSALIESNRVDYNKNLEEASKTNTVIQTRYKDRIKVIYQWGEQNATCNDAMAHLNSYSF